MTPLWLVNLGAYSLQVAALVAAAALLVSALRVSAPRVRLAIWRTLLATCLTLPLLQPWRPAPPSEPSAAADMTTSAAADVAPAAAGGGFNVDLIAVLAVILAAGAALRLAWLGLGFVRLARYRREMTVLEPVPPAMADAFARVGAMAAVGVVEDLPGPVTFGLRRPLVLIPPAVLSLEPALQQSVVCHELLHVRRRDWLWSVSEEIVCALAWFHPAIWWLAAQIDLAREQHVDAEVVRLTGQRKPYLEALLYLASPDRGADLAPAPALLRRRHLARRLLVLAREVSMSHQRIALSIAIIVGLLTLTAGAAAVSFPLVGGTSVEPTLALPATGPAVAEPAVAPPAVQPATQPAAAPKTQGPLRVGGSIAPPKKIKDVRPVYPPAAKEAGVQGTVILEIEVAKDGTVAGTKVLRSVPELDQAARDAVRQWEFQPTLLNGVAVPVIMTVTVKFTLDKDKVEAKPTAIGVPVGVKGGVAGGGVVGDVAGGAEKKEPPRRIYYVAPTYPEDAVAQRVEGVVILQVLIDTNGTAKDVKVLRSVPLLDKAAIDAVRQWRWAPPAMPVTADMTVRFTLDGGAEVTARLNPTGAKLEVVKEVKPTYPPEAREAKVTGTVQVEILVGEDGLVSSVRVLQGADALHQAALNAARLWQFKAPGKPVKTMVEFTFTLR